MNFVIFVNSFTVIKSRWDFRRDSLNPLNFTRYTSVFQREEPFTKNLYKSGMLVMFTENNHIEIICNPQENVYPQIMYDRNDRK